MHSQRETWNHIGSNLVLKSSLPLCDTDLVTGYDTSILTRIAELLRCDDAFRGQCQTLLNGDEIIISTNAILSYTM